MKENVIRIRMGVSVNKYELERNKRKYYENDFKAIR